jgi:hypothetical protein
LGNFLPFGTFCVDLVHFSGFGITNQQKSGNPDSEAHVANHGKTFTQKNGEPT